MKINDDTLNNLLKDKTDSNSLNNLNLYINNINGAPLMEVIDSNNFLLEIPREDYHSKRFKPGD
ncbi:hypothetical protein [Clostridium algidicarnis]|uniref:hypothetical protein n=1 Tax=Clostridium algidicarnis TaxID=37659 RepID=UPI001C0E34FE|nr:hypothetical protein [Clostridium algidicarnis]MBU3197589.1 hypothetical protein [Clostridium algidicarnis]MBU3209848.1 hypothetical protein [Clostridium algidicarnis]MBU3228928.1 hypothetical protein [Clostridium algidicarnis]MBU3252472.1 hypothetical protein [Clostridium algidicarnis]